MNNRTTLISAILMVALSAGPAEAAKPSEALTQERILIDDLGVSFRPIANWHLAGPQAMVENLGRYEFNRDELRRILATSSGSRTIISLMREDPRTVAGIIPTLNVIANPARDTSKEAVRVATETVIGVFRRATHQLEVVEGLSEVPVSGKVAYCFTIEFSLSRAGEITPRIRSRTYVVPCKGVLLQFSMSEAIPLQESAIFDAFVESIEISK